MKRRRSEKRNKTLKYLADISPSVALNILKQHRFYTLLMHHDEYEADEIATKVLYTMNMSPEAASDFLTRLFPDDQESKSHPRSSERVLRIKTLPEPIIDEKPVSEKEPTDFSYMRIKQLAEKEIRKITRKRKFINFVSILAGAACLVPMAGIIYFTFTMQISESKVLGFLQENVVFLLIKGSVFAGLAFSGYGSYLVYEKTYQRMKRCS
jgi:hypothetical protein